LSLHAVKSVGLAKRSLKRNDAYKHIFRDSGLTAFLNRNRQLWRVSGGLATVGLIMFPVGFLFTTLSIFGLFLDGAFGYPLGVSLLGATLLLATPMPTYSRVLRFVAGVGIMGGSSFAALYALLATVIFTGTFCPYESDRVCYIVASSMGFCVLVLLAVAVSFLSVIQLRPASKRRSLTEMWGWAVAELGRPAAVAAVLLCAPGLWGAAQHQGSFVLSSQDALQRSWAIFRLSQFACGCAWTASAIIAFELDESEPVVGSILFFGILMILLSAFATPHRRSRVHTWIGRQVGSDVDTSQHLSNASSVSVAETTAASTINIVFDDLWGVSRLLELSLPFKKAIRWVDTVEAIRGMIPRSASPGLCRLSLRCMAADRKEGTAGLLSRGGLLELLKRANASAHLGNSEIDEALRFVKDNRAHEISRLGDYKLHSGPKSSGVL